MSAQYRFVTAGRAGFTLIEVLVALVIVSLGMMAVKTQLDRYVLTAQFMEDKTLASWIGTNKIVELSTVPAWPEIGDSDEELEFAGRLWRLEIEVSRGRTRGPDSDEWDASGQTACGDITRRPPRPRG